MLHNVNNEHTIISSIAQGDEYLEILLSSIVTTHMITHSQAPIHYHVEIN